jgi:hypothetical protein
MRREHDFKGGSRFQQESCFGSIYFGRHSALRQNYVVKRVSFVKSWVNTLERE